jgi:tRNA A37 threonylcarbamoyladenosine biosynthesis protein TsaE
MGWSPGLQHWTPSCCEAMEDEQADGDVLLLEKALGAGMTILYRLPRTTT